MCLFFFGRAIFEKAFRPGRFSEGKKAFFIYLFFFRARPPVHFEAHELTGTKKKKKSFPNYKVLGIKL